jgi:hypothetical protein
VASTDEESKRIENYLSRVRKGMCPSCDCKETYTKENKLIKPTFVSIETIVYCNGCESEISRKTTIK